MTTVAATCMGIDVPDSPFLNETRIARINAARYEGQEIAGACKVTTSDDRVLEMGAGLGVVGAVVAKTCSPQQVKSYEANPALLEHINALYGLNNLTGTISVTNQVLLSAPDRQDTIPFYVKNSFLGSSLIDADNRQTKRVDVPTGDFNALCFDYKPTVLIMDIEGGELEILRHADLSGIRAVVIEFHPEAYGVPGMRECKRVLTEAGFVKDDEVSTRTVWTCTREI